LLGPWGSCPGHYREVSLRKRKKKIWQRGGGEEKQNGKNKNKGKRCVSYSDERGD